ncbi:MAG TPA: ECF transporter S component [Syntrophales bacterium]|nr:ECF transporter S component [Syntrophales bacterium]
MTNTGTISIPVHWNARTTAVFALMIALPNLLGAINIDTPWGFRLHTFQLVIFWAALIYGPMGGALSGLVGSLYSAFALANPYLAVGNALLGFFTGFFARRGVPAVVAVWLAFAVQLPWLVLTDYFFAGLSMEFIGTLVVALLVSNTVWAVVAASTSSLLRRFFAL